MGSVGLIAGVDVGADRLHCVWLDETGALADSAVFGTSADEFDRAVEQLARAHVVAIDAPQSPVPDESAGHPGLTGKFGVARCAEIALGEQERIWVPWVTPKLADARRWMHVGFDLFECLDGRTAAIEVYPYGAFTVLAKGARLAKKSTPEGVQQRVRLLRSLPDRHLARPNIEMWSHDSLDALVAAEVALDCLHGRGLRVPERDHGCGRYDGSAVWLPRRAE